MARNIGGAAEWLTTIKFVPLVCSNCKAWTWHSISDLVVGSWGADANTKCCDCNRSEKRNGINPVHIKGRGRSDRPEKAKV